MKTISLPVRSLLSAAFFVLPVSVYATNGMNLEGYGPEATAMGGASMAYDNGTAAMMNNPATLGMMKDGNRADIAIGVLGPNITSSRAGATDAESSANAFYMPAIGWAAKSNMLTYGFGIFAQGGMGTEYAADTFMSANSGKVTRSEVGVGRVMVPVSYDITKQLTIGGSVDFVWAGMDLKMAMDGQTQMMDMMPTSLNPAATQTAGALSGDMVDALGGMMGNGAITALNWGYFDFSNDSAFYGEALGTGFSGKLGAVFKVSDKLSIGATYHAKTFMSDLTTSNATVTMNVDGDGGALTTGTPNGTPVAGQSLPVKGTISVNDFQWPSMYGFGVAFKPINKLMLVADVKMINWSEVMDSFKMTFTADSDQGGFADMVMDAELYQKWEDQLVYSVGASYMVTNSVVVRAGLNRGDNPIPDQYLNALFPAVEHNHATVGAGLMINESSTINLSVTYAPEFKPTAGSGVSTGMSQINGQLMYSLMY